MTYPLVKFVDAPDPVAAVRYDFNRDEDGAAARRVMAEGFTLGSPTIEGDPDAIGVTYGRRQPLIPQRVKGSKAEALAALSSLSRELLRQTNWLLVQVDAFTAPVWLKTYRSAFAPLSLGQVYVNTKTGDSVLMPDTWEIQVPLLADAFAYGERETLAPVTVIQAPGGVTNAMRVVLPPIKGDAPVPLRVTIAPSATVGGSAMQGSTWLIGCIAGATDLADPVKNIGVDDFFTAAGGTSAPASDAAYFAGDYRGITVSEAQPNLLPRLSGLLATVPPGRYKVLLRCELTGVANSPSYLLRLNQSTDGGSTFVTGPTVTQPVLATKAFQGWIDLGEFTVPFGLDLPPDVVGPNSAFNVRLDVGVTSGTAGSGRIDAFKLIPIGGPTVSSLTVLKAAFTTPGGTLASPKLGNFDGDSETYWATNAGVFANGTPELTGGFPVADPAAEQNVLIVMATSVGSSGAPLVGGTITSVNAEVAATISYHPRLLHLGDGT